MNSMSLAMFSTLVALGLKFLSSSHSLQKAKNRARLGPKLRWLLLLAVECLCVFKCLYGFKMQVFKLASIKIKWV